MDYKDFDTTGSEAVINSYVKVNDPYSLIREFIYCSIAQGSDMATKMDVDVHTLVDNIITYGSRFITCEERGNVILVELSSEEPRRLQLFNGKIKGDATVTTNSTTNSSKSSVKKLWCDKAIASLTMEDRFSIETIVGKIYDTFISKD